MSPDRAVRTPPASPPGGKILRRVLVVEPNATGHRLLYVRHLLLNPPPGIEVTALVDNRDEVQPFVDAHLSDVDPTRVRGADLSSWALISAAIRATTPDLTVFPDGDRSLLTYCMRRRLPGRVTFLLLRNPYAASSKNARQVIKRGAVWHARHLRRATVAMLTSGFGSPVAPLPLVPDPVTYQPNSAPPEGVLDDGRFWFAVLGHISARKNVALIAEVMASTPSLASAGLLVAGSIAPDQIEILRELQATDAQPDRIHTVDRLLADGELDAIVARAGCIVIAHSNEGPSGLLGKAAAAGTPVVTSGAITLREDSALIPEIAVWAPLDREALANAMIAAARADRPAHPVRVATPADFVEALLADEPALHNGAR